MTTPAIDPAFTAGMGRAEQPQNRQVVDRYITLRQQAAQVMWVLRGDLYRAKSATCGPS